MRNISLSFFWILLLCLIVGCHSSKKHVSNNNRYREISVLKDLEGERKKIVEEALTWEGVKYLYGGNDKKTGTDCSGMVLSVYLNVLGVKLPRNSAKQAEFCKKIRKENVKPGDLSFFATGKDPDVVSHVGIMLDNRYFIHSSTSKGVVISDIETPYYQRTFKMYGRVEKVRPHLTRNVNSGVADFESGLDLQVMELSGLND